MNKFLVPISLLFIFLGVNCQHVIVTPPSLPAPAPGQALAWEKNHPERAAWSTELRAQILENLSAFSSASDWNEYCKDFANKSTSQKVDVVATLAVSISLYESSYNAASVFVEPPPLGVDSIGLYQLSYTDNMKWCSMSASQGNLVDPVVNIDCAIPKMAALIAEDKVVASGQAQGTRKALARYWSTMWPKSHLNDVRKAVQELAFCQ